MSKVIFKKGLLANLPAAITEGAFYITTDERAIYLDIDGDTRIRVGDFQEFATLSDLQANANPSVSALYYVADLNCLAKWNGTKYVQINLDTGATSVEVTGTGNALDGVTYDPATRKLTFTKTKTFTTANDVDAQIAAKVGELKIGEESFATVKAYIDKKTDGIATDEALTSLGNRVKTTEEAITKLNGDKTVEGSVENKVAAAITDAIGTNPDNKTVAELFEEAKKAGDDAQAAVDTLIGDDTNKTARQIANEELAKQLIPENASEALDTLAEIAAWIQSHPNDASAMNKAIDDLNTLVGTLPEDATATNVVAYIKEYADSAIAALSIGDYAKAADLTAAVTRIAALENKSHEHTNGTVLDGITADKVSAWDAAEQNAKDYTDESLTWGSF